MATRRRKLEGLDPALLERIRLERPIAVLATADRKGRPYSSMISWWVARAPNVLALALDRRGQSLQNLAENPSVSMNVLGEDLVLSITGNAEVVREQIRAAPFKMAEVVVTVTQIVDQTVGGVRFKAPSYAYDSWKAHRGVVEERVLAELSSGPADAPAGGPVAAHEDPKEP